MSDASKNDDLRVIVVIPTLNERENIGPMLSALLLSPTDHAPPEPLVGGYTSFLRRALRHRGLVVCVAALVLVIGGIAAKLLGFRVNARTILT